MNHLKIKCKNEKKYEQSAYLLKISGVRFYQKAPDKPIHVYDTSEKDLKKLYEKHKIKVPKIKEVEPDFEAAVDFKPVEIDIPEDPVGTCYPEDYEQAMEEDEYDYDER